MAFFAKQKLSYYRKFRIDIWGLLKTTLVGFKDRTNYGFGALKGRVQKVQKIMEAKVLEIKRAKLNYKKFSQLYKEKKIDKRILNDKILIIQKKRIMQRLNS